VPDLPVGCAAVTESVTCALGTIAAGAEETIELGVAVDPATCADITDVASVVASDEPAGNVDDANRDTVTDTVACATPGVPDLVLDATSDTTDPVPRGNAIAYTLSVTNVGDATATGIHLHDDVPPGLQISGALPTMQGGTCSAIATVDSDGNEYYAIDCTRGSLAAGASATATIRVRVDPDARCGRLVDTASVRAANEPRAQRDASNGDTVTNHVVCEPSIALAVRGPSSAHVGDEVTYTFRASNDGERPLVGVHVRAAVCDGAIARSDRRRHDHMLARGETWVYTCTHAIVETDDDPMRATATVTAGADDGRRVHATSRRWIDVLHPGIAIAVTSSTVSGRPGAAVTFTYVVTNTGDTPLFDVRIVDDVLGAVGMIASIRPGDRHVVTSSDVLPDAAAVVTEVGTASARDGLGASVSGADEAVVTVVAANPGGSGQHGGGAFTGADTATPAAVAAGLLVLGIVATATARRGPKGRTET
jgi:uncharacterized repeat protein (TIGR01451 family)